MPANEDRASSSAPRSGNASDPTVAFRCDVGPNVGVGHVMRSIALAEELASRGCDVLFVCDADSVPWARQQIRRREFRVLPAVSSPQAHVNLFVGEGVDAVVFDSYLLPRSVYRAVRSSVPTLAFVDSDLRGAEADLLLDQNIGAEDEQPDLPAGSQRLAGLSYALLRNDVLNRRPRVTPSGTTGSIPSVLGVFGGTDAYSAAPVVARALVATGLPFTGTLITREDLVGEVLSIPRASGQSFEVLTPTEQLPDLILAADLVVSAAGSSTWELLALGAASALVLVAENQSAGYQRLVSEGLAFGLGCLEDLRGDGAPFAREALGTLLSDPAKRSSLSASAWSRVDGMGRVRVADRFLALVSGQ